MPRLRQKRTRRKPRKNRLLSTITYQGNINIPTQVELIQYNKDELRTMPILGNVDLQQEIKEDDVNWFKVVGISDVDYINEICRGCGLHGFDIRDLMSNMQVVKAVTYDNVTFILLPGFSFDDNNELQVTQFAFVLGSNFIISIQETVTPVFDDIIKSLGDRDITMRQNQEDFLLYILLNEVNTLNLNSIIRIEDQLLDIEDQMIEHDTSSNAMSYLRVHRINYIKIKRSLLAIREEYNNLQRNSNRLIRDENIVYFNDFDDKLRTTLSDLETCHELLSSLLDLHYSNNNLRMNEIIQRLTIVSTIFIPLTFLAGVWGMNFRFMPELEWKLGYLLAWGSFVVVVVTVLYIMRKKRWF